MSARTSGDAADGRDFGLDLGRILAAAGVAAIHAWWFAPAAAVAMATAGRFAVPFFLMVTGCFLSLERTAWMTARRTFARIAPPLLVWAALYNALPLWRGALEPTVPELARILFLGGVAGHLWYLSAALIAATLVTAAARAWPIAAVLWLAGALYAVTVATTSWSAPLGLGTPDTYWVRNGAVAGFAFVALGLAVRRTRLAEMPRPRALMLALLGAAGLAAETAWLSGVQGVPVHRLDFTLSLPVLVLGVFLSLRGLPAPGALAGRVVGALAGVTLGVYAVHLFVLQRLAGPLGATTDTPAPMALAVFAAALAISWAIAFALDRVRPLRPLVR